MNLKFLGDSPLAREFVNQLPRCASRPLQLRAFDFQQDVAESEQRHHGQQAATEARNLLVVFKSALENGNPQVHHITSLTAACNCLHAPCRTLQ